MGRTSLSIHRRCGKLSALDADGFELISENGEGPGVRLRKGEA